MLTLELNVISKRGLSELAKRHPETVEALNAWYRVTKRAEWYGLNDVRRMFPSADQVGSASIFNVLGNHYRLITTVSYRGQKVFVKALLTHTQYDRKDWMKWA